MHFTALIPVIITGSFCTLITNVVCATEGNGISLGKLPGMQWLSNVYRLVQRAANYATLNFLFTVAAVVLIGLELGKLNKMQGFMPGIIALCSFVSCLPSFVEITNEGAVIQVANVIGKDYTASRGLFLVSLHLFQLKYIQNWLQSEVMKINMPDSVQVMFLIHLMYCFPSMVTILICALFNFVY